MPNVVDRIGIIDCNWWGVKWNIKDLNGLTLKDTPIFESYTECVVYAQENNITIIRLPKYYDEYNEV